MTMGLSPSTQMRTVDTLRKTVPLYVFRDTAIDSPPSVGLTHITVDLNANLNRIGTTLYNSESDFQQDIASVFMSLKDPHTVYSKPQCYDAAAVQPMALNSRLNANGQQEIFVDGLFAFSQAPQYANFPLQDYVGAVVTSIDGVPAMQALLDYSSTYGFLSKDMGAAFNFILSSVYQTRVLQLFPFPVNPSQTMVLQTLNNGQQTVTIPWYVILNGPTSISFTQTTCTATANKRSTSGVVEHLTPKKIMKLSAPLLHKLPSPNPIQALQMRQVTPSNLGATPTDIFVFSVSPQVVALQILDFEPANTADFLTVVNQALTTGATQNAPYLIVDVRGNGGGDICLGYQVINLLTNERHPEGRYDVIQNPLTLQLAKTAIGQNVPPFSADYWNKPDGTTFQDISWYTPGVVYTRGGINDAYSQRIYHACTYPTANPPYQFQKIAVLSDGTCGSTCAVFTSHLDEVDSVITVAMGGIAGQPMQYFSFPGGEVLPLTGLQAVANFLGVTNQTIVPAAFPNTASLTFAFLEIYPWFKNQTALNLPLEFIFRSSNHRLDTWPIPGETPAQQEALYQQVATLFTQ
jgi:hypothetical protein